MDHKKYIELRAQEQIEALENMGMPSELAAMIIDEEQRIRELHRMVEEWMVKKRAENKGANENKLLLTSNPIPGLLDELFGKDSELEESFTDEDNVKTMFRNSSGYGSVGEVE